MKYHPEEKLAEFLNHGLNLSDIKNKFRTPVLDYKTVENERRLGYRFSTTESLNNPKGDMHPLLCYFIFDNTETLIAIDYYYFNSKTSEVYIKKLSK